MSISIERIFPNPITNDYGGAAIAKWTFALVTLLTLGRSLIHAFSPDGGAQSIATIPLDEFTTNGKSAVIHIFSQWGLSQLLFGIFYLIVLSRYKSLMPLMWIFILIEYTCRLLLGLAKLMMGLHGTPPGAVGNLIIIPLALIMLFLSLRVRQNNSDRT